MHFFIELGPEPAFGRPGLDGSLGEYISHGYTSHASLRAYGAQLGEDRFFEFRESECQQGALSGGKQWLTECQQGPSQVENHD